MKTGKSLMDLAKELTRTADLKKDFIVPTEKLEATVSDAGKLNIGFQNGSAHAFGLTPWSASQLAGDTEIPKQYFDRIAGENPLLLADAVNHGLSRMTGKKRMLRTLDGNVRGLVSDTYRIMDSHDLLEAVFPVLADKGMEVVSSEITDKRLYIKALSPKLQGEVKKGDVVQHGLVISTSDVGAGSFRVEPLVFRLACLNGMISSTAIRKYHSGGRNVEDLEMWELFSAKTRELSDAAFWAQIRDTVLASLKPENFERELDRLRLAANEPILNFDLPRVVELVMQSTRLTGENKKNSILSALASGNEGAGLTRWGLINSVTRAAQSDEFDYQTSVEMERAAGQILELPAKAWSLISSAA